MAYLLNKPQATDLLSESQPVIRDNFNTADSVMSIDHYPFSDATANKGQHKVIQQYQSNRTRSGVGATTANFPAAAATIGKLFTAAYTPDSTVTSADTQLFFLTGNGGLSQLTGNSTAGITDGWCWSSGILIQWGRVTGLLGTTNQFGDIVVKDRVAGAIPFPNNIFNVQATLISTGSGITDRGTVSFRAISTNQLRWVVTQGSGGYSGFYWYAIGN